MLWSPDTTYMPEPFDAEAELEAAVKEVAPVLFGPARVYLDAKKKIGAAGKTRNIPDGYLVDLSSTKEPKLYVVENELAKHDPLRHIAVQILEFSLSFETSQHRLKTILREAIVQDAAALKRCDEYIADTGFENLDVLLERIVYGGDRFNALVIIDELSEELATVLASRFQFPVEMLTIERYKAASGERLYRFEPFLHDVAVPEEGRSLTPLDPSDIDTVVVPARDEGFQETFVAENRWYKIRMHSSMIPRIKYVAVYRVAPTSAITHIAPVASIEQWPDSSKYVLNFSAPPTDIGPIPLAQGGTVRAPQAPRYTSRDRLESAKTLDEAF